MDMIKAGLDPELLNTPDAPAPPQSQSDNENDSDNDF
jgi:hypothetical protein